MKAQPSSHQKTYLVTGAAGFIGSRFVESCHRLGISLICVDEKSLFQSRPENQNLQFGQIIDRDSLLSELGNLLTSKTSNGSSKVYIDAIIHLGAITDTRESNIALLNRLNLHYTQALWSFASEHQIPFIYASSAATYGDGTLGFDDDESLMPKLKPLNAYGDSKLQFDLWALNREKENHHPPRWAGFKFFNVYGFGERHKGFMSSVAFHAFEEIRKTGQMTLFKSHRAGIPDGLQKRDFISVQDVIQVLHFAIDRPIVRGIYNLGTGQARSFLDLGRAVFSAMNRAEKISFIDTPLALRDKYQYLTEAKMDRLLRQGYPGTFTSLEDGVKEYVSRLTESSPASEGK